MLRVDTGCGVDLKCVVIVSGVLEEAIDGVEHLVRQQKEEFSKGELVNGSGEPLTQLTLTLLHNLTHPLRQTESSAVS